MGGMGVGAMSAMGRGPDRQAIVTETKFPRATFSCAPASRVHATDGAIGRIKGLAASPSDHHVTHILLDDGHLWGHKRVAIPIGAVNRVDDDVRLNLAKDQVRDLPAIDVPDRA